MGGLGNIPRHTPRIIRFGDVSFPYWIGRACLDDICGRIAELGADRILLVSDDTVMRLHGRRFATRLAEAAPVTILSAPTGEAMKSGAVLMAHLERAITEGATRRSLVVAFGGGVPGNLGGMVAALLFRGVRLVHVPTTLVAAADSVISAKQAINGAAGKNHFGVFHPATAVHVDLALLESLPSRELRSGLGELAKNCLAIRPEALPRLLSHLQRGQLTDPKALRWFVEESLAGKLTVMAEDPEERGRGVVLEYGHTVGHAIELADWTQRGADGLSHGESVVLGMLTAARLAQRRSGLPPEAVERHEEVAEALGIVPRLPGTVCPEDVIALVARDNKRGYLALDPEEAAMVLLRGLGCPAGPVERPLVAVPMQEIVQAVATLAPTLAPAPAPAPVMP